MVNGPGGWMASTRIGARPRSEIVTGGPRVASVGLAVTLTRRRAVATPGPSRPTTANPARRQPIACTQPEPLLWATAAQPSRVSRLAMIGPVALAGAGGPAP